MSRQDGRERTDMRHVQVTRDYIKHPDGACLIEVGETRVVCTASIEEIVPQFLKNSGQGWVTAEYAMLPGSCATRIKRSLSSGRSFEIQRLIGRSLRAVVDMEKLGERTIKIDCDVIQADGGTRTASITGGFIAMALGIKKLMRNGVLTAMPLTDFVAAVSVGIYQDQIMLDLDYSEDSKADMDMNVVMIGKGDFVEVQGTAEGKTFNKDQMNQLLLLADMGIKDLICIQKETVGNIIAG
ncbi:MAG: ribonuclease PH [Candidatus Omnitrophica bacterium]|nr:ribonuclease PH [Candidatus Omnitrophota bacterium]